MLACSVSPKRWTVNVISICDTNQHNKQKVKSRSSKQATKAITVLGYLRGIMWRIKHVLTNSKSRINNAIETSSDILATKCQLSTIKISQDNRE